jgi:hypothetical protein
MSFFDAVAGIIIGVKSSGYYKSGGIEMLTISPEKVCYIIIKAHEFDAKVEPVEEEPGSNPTDSGEREILEDYPNDPTYDELIAAIDTLNEDETIELVALAWLGRGDFTADAWAEAVAEARAAHNDRTASYLVGMPLLGDYLEEGLSQLGYSCEEYEAERL